MPLYPRRRSVTFASNLKNGYRGEGSNYEVGGPASAPVSPIRERALSPVPVPILKQHSSYNHDVDNDLCNYSDKQNYREKAVTVAAAAVIASTTTNAADSTISTKS
uniref:Uncharacterized protein n=1 Tax=Lygus hesperus TaxID=30085 RepID=A0A146KUD8_LYGHE